MMRHRFAFYALFPLVAFAAFVIPAKWLVMLGLISLGMFPLSLILGIAFLPVFTVLLVCCSVGIVSLWISLRWERKLARWMSILPLFFIPICIYLTQFLAKTTAQQDANYVFLHLDVLALQAHLVYPLLAIVLAVLVWTRKATKPEAQAVAASSIGQTLLMWGAILAVWTLAAFTLLSTQESIKQYLVQIRVDSEHVIESDNHNTIVTAVCAGQIAQADKLINDIGAKLSEGDVSELIGTCLKKRIGDTRTNAPPPFYGDRVGVILKAILSYERSNGVSVQNGCSPYRSLLLKEIYRNNIDERGLHAFQQKDLPVNCPVRINDGSFHPVWWNVIYSDAMIVTYDKLIRLEKIGISLMETDSHGNQFFSSNWNGFCDDTDDSALLHLIERGVSTSFIKSDTPPLSIELSKRRFGYRRDHTKTDDFEKLLEVVGEPDLQSSLDAKNGRWWSFPSRKESDPNSIALHDYLDKRIAELEGQKQHIKKAPNKS